MVIQSYTVSSLKDIELLPFLKRAQFTLNGRMSPSKRRTVEALRKMNLNNTEIYIHYDFLRTIPRYLMMNDGCRREMIAEIADLLRASLSIKNIKGIVIHMDTSFKKEFLKDYDKVDLTDENVKSLCMKHISSPMYRSPYEIADLIIKYIPLLKEIEGIKSELLQEMWYNESFKLFNKHLTDALKGIIPLAKVYLENTTHVSGGPAGKVKNNAYLASLDTKFGVCWDTEHGFAADDVEFNEVNLLNLQKRNIPVMVHLNTIEKGVTKGSLLDRHSKTTIFECSNFTTDYYESIVSMLDKNGIPYIREVKSDTMERELEQIVNFNNENNG